MNRVLFAVCSLATIAFLPGCPRDKETGDGGFHRGEAREALEESSADAQAQALTTNSIEIATNFTIGKGVNEAASELRTFIETQLPCADIQVEESTLTVVYGARPGPCVYRGQTFTGEHAITVAKDDEGDVQVDHTWTELSNGKVKVTGKAHVTWSRANESRHATHELTWTRIADGRTGVGTADIVQKALPEGLATGIQIDGSRSWTGAKGTWDLAVEGVQVRWEDPVPQAGLYRLASPLAGKAGRSVEVSFARLDDDTIKVTLTGEKRSFAFQVTSSTGAVTDQN